MKVAPERIVSLVLRSECLFSLIEDMPYARPAEHSRPCLKGETVSLCMAHRTGTSFNYPSLVVVFLGYSSVETGASRALRDSWIVSLGGRCLGNDITYGQYLREGPA